MNEKYAMNSKCLNVSRAHFISEFCNANKNTIIIIMSKQYGLCDWCENIIYSSVCVCTKYSICMFLLQNHYAPMARVTLTILDGWMDKQQYPHINVIQRK